MNATPMALRWLTFNQCLAPAVYYKKCTYTLTIHTRPFCIYRYIRTCTSVCIHAVVIVVSNLRSWPVHSAMKRERVIANAALTLASGGKFKALLAWPTLSFSWAIVGGERAESQCVLTTTLH